MTIKDGQQMKVIMPGHLFAALQSEAKDTAMPMANLVRLAVQQRYEQKQNRQAERLQPLRLLGQMCALGLMPADKALEQLTTIVSNMPVPYVITEAGEAAIASP